MTDATPIASAAAAPTDTPGGRPGPGRLSGVSAIWVRELRGRMRGKRAFVFLTFYLVVLVLLLWAALNAATANGPLHGLEGIAFGRGLFAAVILIETLVVVILGPAYTAPSISQEREKQTFDLLAVTPISSLAIVLGKLVGGLSFLAIVVAASAPLAALAFLFGGTPPEALVMAYLILAVVAVGAGSIGVCCSSVMKKSQPATVASFIVMALIAIGTPAAWFALDAQAAERHTDRPSVALLYLNPFYAQADLLCSTTGNLCLLPGRIDGGAAILAPPPAGFGDPQPIGPPPPLVRSGTFWPVSLLAWIVTTAVLLAIAAQKVSPTRGWFRVSGRTVRADPATDGPQP